MEVSQFSDGCPFDYIEVRDGASESDRLLAKICESNPNSFSVQSTRNFMWIR